MWDLKISFKGTLIKIFFPWQCEIFHIPYSIFHGFVKLWLQRKFNFQKMQNIPNKEIDWIIVQTPVILVLNFIWSKFYLQYIMSVTNPRNSSLRSHLLWDESRVQCLILWPFLPYFMTFFLEEELGRDAVRDLEWRVLNYKHIQHCLQRSFYQTTKWAFFQYWVSQHPQI